MSLVDQLRAGRRPLAWSDLGFLENPFPQRGKVHPRVYLSRLEVAGVEESLATFLQGAGEGRTWAVAGETGVGKSNFLQHLWLELERAVSEGLVERLAYSYLTSQQMNPRALTDSIARAFGEERIAALFDALRIREAAVRREYVGTQLGEMLRAVGSGQIADSASAAAFTIRWLGGQQTYAWEREPFGIRTRERIAPAMALPWLRHLLDLMVDEGLLTHVVLMLDEFEDVQALSTAAQGDYLTTLKGLVNAFNVERLFLVIAGQRTAFLRMGERFPSLKERWQVVALEPLRKPEEAVRYAQECMNYGRQQWLAQNLGAVAPATWRPSELEIKAKYGDLLSQNPTKGVTQRDLFAALHDYVEEIVRGVGV